MLKMLIKETGGQPRRKVSKVIPNPLLMIPVSPSRRRELMFKSSIYFFGKLGEQFVTKFVY